jgi:hypothetical protein
MATRLDRFARSTRDPLNTLAAITAKKAGFRSLGNAWEINRHLAELNGSIADWRRVHHALHAQLLIQELTKRDFEFAQREQRRQASIMVVCTVIITVLTIVIAILTAIMAWR